MVRFNQTLHRKLVVAPGFEGHKTGDSGRRRFSVLKSMSNITVRAEPVRQSASSRSLPRIPRLCRPRPMASDRRDANLTSELDHSARMARVQEKTETPAGISTTFAIAYGNSLPISGFQI